MRKILFVLLSLSYCFPCLATTYIVDQNGFGDYTTIQAAINASNNGYQIEVAPGTYNEAINFNGMSIHLYSRSGPGVTIIDGSGYYHVVKCVNYEGTDTILEGFTITGGNANGNFPDNSGGGMYNYYYSSPTVINCIFTQNYADENGGGIYNNLYCNPTVTGCVFSNNIAGYGGGIYNLYYSSPSVTDCTFSQNSADANGGGMYNDSSSPTVAGCIFSSNLAINGGGIYNDYSSPTITSCTFSQNSADANGGGMYNYYFSSPALTNCILWDDSPDEIEDDTSTPTVTFSDIQGGYSGDDNIDVNPNFAYPIYSDYHLRSIKGRWDPNSQSWITDDVTSPCIDAGDPNYDWMSELWPNGERINMGAYGGTSQASMSTSALGNIADFNHDNKVDCEDLQILCGLWLDDNLLLAPNLNRTGLIDFRDLCIFADNWLWQE